MEYVEKTAKTVEEAITEALIELGTTSDNVDIEVVDNGTKGILGIFNSKPAKVRVTKKLTFDQRAVQFLDDVFQAMGMDAHVKATVDEDNTMNIDVSGDNMGMLIGRRGQTLDAVQYLVSLVVNKYSDDYVKVKVDTENYRQRRKESLENYAKSMASKAKKSGKKVVLEPMNPFERRIIHSILQGDRYIETHSEGEEPNRQVVIVPVGNRKTQA